MDSRGQSAITGELLTVGVVIIAAATLGLFAFGFASDVSETGPAADFDVAVQEGQVAFTHEGGDSVATEELAVTFHADGGGTARKTFEDVSVKRVAAGNRLATESPFATTEMRVLLTHESSGAVLLDTVVTVEATKAAIAGPIGRLGSTNDPATDRDGDGDFEDVDGDGTVTVADTIDLYYAYLDIVSNDAYDGGSAAADLYDFDDDGDFDVNDVLTHLYFETGFFTP
jgi:FlaG/FlaF family flagellin (archaellin)